ncbi:electron transport complex protein RnfC [Plasticicumulans lactativorans]|uniref:Ion-translocating oxidoreductase complex subunit C n=1 Tax=Plasticicumulans lactativorans TaxID=1133106 RepID=A0A4R2LU36_9GAMM|nr:electron transport complex subunit RsxC [Plasticicumulans lactativorans]TCO83383.1 electron transport complex protein RnfC [Plasticicumulans lactativorans]
MGVLDPLVRLWRFNGGLHPPTRKAPSNAQPARALPPPPRLLLPLTQHVGAAARPVVNPGQHVGRGELLAAADGYVSAALHAPTSGTVVALEARPIAHPSGLSAPCLVLDADDADAWGALPAPLADWRTAAAAEIRRRVREAGIVGLGGAAFPTAVKLAAEPPPNLLIVNGAECEPYITCDDRLMRERAAAIVGGVLILRHALGAAAALVAIEDDKPEALAAMRAAVAASGAAELRVQAVPTRYPSGGERQLIRVLTGREVPSGGLPAELGIVCQNVATAAAVFEAITTGRPLTARYVTVTGAGVHTPQVVEARIGTPVADLVAACGGYTAAAARLIYGGPMMGFALADDGVPLGKGGNCILVAGATELAPPAPALPCIRCGDCVRACPADLLPQQLYWHARAREFERAGELGLFDCIECGCCAAVCPSRLPLVQYYRHAKGELLAAERERHKADLARERHGARQARQAREEAERAARLAAKKAHPAPAPEAAAPAAATATAPASVATAPTAAASPAPTTTDDPRQAAIAAALARAQARRARAAADATAGTSTDAAPGDDDGRG